MKNDPNFDNSDFEKTTDKFDRMDPELKRFSKNFNIQLFLGQMDYTIRALEDGNFIVELDPIPPDGVEITVYLNKEVEHFTTSVEGLYEKLREIFKK